MNPNINWGILETSVAYRLISTEQSRELVPSYAPEIGDKKAREIEAYKRMADDLLFRSRRLI